MSNANLRWVSFQPKDSRPSFGFVDGEYVVDMGRERPDCPDLKSWIAAGLHMRAEPSPRAERHELGKIMFLPVIPDPGKIICVGLNYREHVAETGRSDSEYPALFLRTRISQCGHLDDLQKPRESSRFDYEGELAVIIGTPGRDIATGEAMRHVAGVSCYNDGSVRDWQRHTHQWTPGKNFDRTGAFGPWMVAPDAIADRANTSLVTRVNGSEVQRATLAQMIFSIEHLVAYISRFTMLEPGDVIVTGTPGGVGDRREPPLYLTPGDRVTVTIDGIGTLENGVSERT